MEKTIKDPIYGNIRISDSLINKVIDKPEFQRLRRIIQTSYSPLYPSCLHNRFVHSLGVFYLGCLARQNIENFLKDNELFKTFYENNETEILKVLDIFEYACLLHDVGHAPFSHSCEERFCSSTNENSKSSLNKDLIDAVGEEDFTKDVTQKYNGQTSSAKYHEIMSAIIGVKRFNLLNDNSEKAFFSRCITGYTYTQDLTDIKQFKNIMIRLLNSDVFDVDKIDYLIRDSYFSGCQNVEIDYERFFSSLMIVKDHGNMKIALHKHALNVLNNLVYAKDFEKKWLLKHPRIIYESRLLDEALDKLFKNINNGKELLFSEKSLSVDGCEIEGRHFMLLTDDDVISLLKDKCPDEAKKLFNRCENKKSLWKSEEEYKSCFNSVYGEGILHEQITGAIEDLIGNKQCNLYVNKDSVENYKKNVETLSKNGDDFANSGLEFKEDCLKILLGLEQYASENNLELDFEIIKSDGFKTAFAEPNFGQVLISFDWKGKQTSFLKDVSDVFRELTENKKFSYIYFNKKSSFHPKPFEIFDIWVNKFRKQNI